MKVNECDPVKNVVVMGMNTRRKDVTHLKDNVKVMAFVGMVMTYFCIFCG